MTRCAALPLLLLLSACATAPRPAPPLPADADVSAGSSALGFDLLALEPKDETALFSPVSISTAFGLVYLGSRGRTQAQLRETLRFGPETDEFARALGGLQRRVERDTGRTVVNVENAVFKAAQLTYQPGYAARAGAYDATFRDLDFCGDAEGATDTINSWVSGATNGLIETVYDEPLNIRTTDVLVNTIYLRAPWSVPMNEGEMEFTGPAGRLTVPSVSELASFRRLDRPGFDAIALRFEDPELEAIVVLPDRGQSVDAIELALAESGLPKLLEDIAAAEFTRSAVELPKLSISGSYRLKDKFIALGATDPFDQYTADFGGRLAPTALCNGGGAVFINQVIHKTVLDLDEIGVEAAAVTAIDSIVPVSAVQRPDPVPFIVDRPFILVITHAPSGAPLFIARVTDPGEVDG